MALPFEDEVRAGIARAYEQDPTVHAMSQRRLRLEDMDADQALALLIRITNAQNDLLVRAAQEIDQLRACGGA